MEHDTPLREATGARTSATEEVAIFLAERTARELLAWRWEWGWWLTEGGRIASTIEGTRIVESSRDERSALERRRARPDRLRGLGLDSGGVAGEDVVAEGVGVVVVVGGGVTAEGGGAIVGEAVIIGGGVTVGVGATVEGGVIVGEEVVVCEGVVAREVVVLGEAVGGVREGVVVRRGAVEVGAVEAGAAEGEVLEEGVVDGLAAGADGRVRGGRGGAEEADLEPKGERSGEFGDEEKAVIILSMILMRELDRPSDDNFSSLFLLLSSFFLSSFSLSFLLFSSLFLFSSSSRSRFIRSLSSASSSSFVLFRLGLSSLYLGESGSGGRGRSSAGTKPDG